ncbi:Chromosome segregation protein Spo0J, contains ParB-like nuclease domain [Actinomadura meyerae]|uniref:Chromosome segregation protein Spo0J, contains ParB-like nuclease domain n=1 Tax=Actinomadura meyerae TaxID=240840 RepID=A0A239NZG3_9ACTN|nr:ParB/RepB/Spo0J family partition protein [Actinomadura meyerae]SNT60281.1 Chromosome segregation protein Spo0J, contains ParB-like nuclease domain [Actinomadura meyerae]
MVARYGIPPEGEAIRELVQERLKQAAAEDGAKVTVDWRGAGQRHLYVISMPVSMLYFNPDTHRVRAQRTLDPERNRVLDERPWSEEGQEYLRYLLTRDPKDVSKTDPDYLALLDELDEFGQRDPGIISPDGILVDGNTRCAALRDLGKEHIRVGVLPEDTSRHDINRVELSLQLRRDKRRDYSYINRLIAVEEELAAGRKQEDVAKEFNIKLPTLKRDRWVFELINDAIERSKTDDGASLRLVDFEDHQEKLRELARDYANLAATDPEAAERLKEARLAMVVLDLPKTTLRLAEPDFYSRYLEQRLPEPLLPTAGESPASLGIPGLDDVVVPDEAAGVKAVRDLTDKLLKADAAKKAADKVSSTEVSAADTVLEAAKEVFSTATTLAGKDAQLRKRQTAVPVRVTDAAEYIEQCAAEFAEARARRALDEEAFDDALITLRDSLARLAKQAGRTFTSPGDGVEWLLNATKDR